MRTPLFIVAILLLAVFFIRPVQARCYADAPATCVNTDASGFCRECSVTDPDSGSKYTRMVCSGCKTTQQKDSLATKRAICACNYGLSTEKCGMINWGGDDNATANSGDSCGGGGEKIEFNGIEYK